MAEPEKRAQIEQVQRNALGQVLPGSPTFSRNGGRPAKPEWLAAKGEAALRYIADVADGTEFAEPELRLKAAQMIADRHYGKPTEQVDISAVVDVVESRTVRLVRARPTEKVVEATNVVDSHRLDAE